MQLIVEIPDDIIARSCDDSLELSLDINHRGIIKNVINQEYGYNELKFTTMNNLDYIDIAKLKKILEI